MRLEYSKALRSKNWTAAAVAERWGLSKQGVSKIASQPTQRDLDALNGLPDRTDAVATPTPIAIALVAIREAVDTLPDYEKTLDNDQSCDVVWVKERLSIALKTIEETPP